MMPRKDRMFWPSRNFFFSAAEFTPALLLTCFRKFSLRFRGESYRLRNSKAAELLACLACEKGGPISKARLAERLWPGVASAQALDSLYKVCRFIRCLNFEGIGIPLRTELGEVALDLKQIACDLALFDRMTERGATPESWRRAVELYTGPVLAEETYGWSFIHEAYYEMRLAELLEKLIEHSRSEGKAAHVRFYQAKLSACLGER